MTRWIHGMDRARVLVAGAVLALVLGVGCSKASKKSQQRSSKARPESMGQSKAGSSSKKSGPAAMRPSPDMGRQVSTPKAAGDNATGGMAVVAARPGPGPGKLGPAQKALLKTLTRGILASKPTAPYTLNAPTIKPSFNLFFGLNVARIRKTPVWKVIQANPTFQRYLHGDVFQAIIKAIRLKPTRVTDELVVGFVSPYWRFGAPQEVVVRFKGRFDTARIMARLHKLPAKLLGQTRVLRIAGKPALFVAAPGLQPFVLIAVRKNVLAFTSLGIAPNVAKELPGFGDPAMVTRLKAVDRKALLWGGFGRIDGLLGGLKMAAGVGAIRRISGGTFGAKHKKGRWRAEARIHTTSPLVSEDLVTLLTMGKAALAAGGSKLLPPVLLNVLKKMKMKRQNKDVLIGVELSKGDALAIPAVMMSLMR